MERNFVDDSSVHELIIAVRDGNDSAFSALADKYSPMINTLVGRFSDCRGFTEGEIRSDALAALHRAAFSYDFSQVNVSFGLYARICIYNALVDLTSKRRVEMGEMDVERVAVTSGIQGRLEKEESLRALRTLARQVLSEYEYQVFSLTLAGYKPADIAKELSKSVKSVDNAKARMLKALRLHLDELFDK